MLGAMQSAAVARCRVPLSRGVRRETGRQEGVEGQRLKLP